MANDVRSLLRNERASRRIDHPQASYSATGTLECNVCHISLKSDAEVWSRHLKSTQHAMRAERQRLSKNAPSINLEPAQTTRVANNGSKKRKQSDGDEDPRKKTRPVISFTEPEQEANEAMTVPSPQKMPIRSEQAAELLSAPPPIQDIDEAEWAAFERDLATPPPHDFQITGPSALMAAATISAAPLSAADIAAREKEEERISGKERREAELEAEKEDATLALEEEFDEMEGLEERVRRLREKREALRRLSSTGKRPGGNGDVVDPSAERDKDAGGENAMEESEDEDDGLDEWEFGR
ncbi:MAG: hypothetical protein Q9163_002903 [Psora crenata]